MAAREKKGYGAFCNVRLTDEEYAKLCERFRDAQRRIEDASLYLSAKGDKYKSHYAMLLYWDRMDRQRRAQAAAQRPRQYDREY